ncbi:MAG TPA: hypothetical protein VFT43_04655 [Candidatus Polarisedimenticolia bacterium]|nr:hypothetical protein [Candidatus Polarisedimenticolia bacterium]
MSRCPSCGAVLPRDEVPCESCGRLLAGAREVVVEPLRQEAAVAYGLLQSAGLHPILAYRDESGASHPIDAEEAFNRGAGLMVPVTTQFAVYVPEDEAEESSRILEDARRAWDQEDAGSA